MVAVRVKRKLPPLPEIRDGEAVAIDTETTGLKMWRGDRPFMFQVCNEAGDAGLIEFEVNPRTRMPILTASKVKAIQHICENPNTAKVFHNSKFDIRMLEFIGVGMAGDIHDTEIMAAVANPDEINFKLKRLADSYLDMGNQDEKDLKAAVMACRRIAKVKRPNWKIADDWKGDYWLPKLMHREIANGRIEVSNTYKDRWRAWGGLCGKYGILDAIRTMKLYQMYLLVHQDLEVSRVYRLERKLWPTVYAMETRGILASKAGIDEVTKKANKQRDAAIKSLGVKETLLNSPKQLQQFLFVKHKLPIMGKTKTGQPSTAEKFLNLMPSSPVIDSLRAYRAAERLLTNYLDSYKEKGVELADDYEIHANFKSTGAKTLRFSCVGPNLQNVPKRPKQGKEILLEARAPFHPRPGYRWLLADYCQIEARLFAMEAQERVMLATFNAGRDVYQELADRINKATRIGISRQEAKQIFLAQIYGQGVALLSAILGVSEERGYMLVQAFHTAFPRVKAWSREVIREVERVGYAVTPSGHKCPLGVGWAYRGVNYKIQGEAAAMIKRAMVRCDRLIARKGWDAHIVMQIHDELVFEIADADWRYPVIQSLRLTMENTGYSVATPTDLEMTDSSWLESRKVAA